jgi:hypothetical protein
MGRLRWNGTTEVLRTEGGAGETGARVEGPRWRRRQHGEHGAGRRATSGGRQGPAARGGGTDAIGWVAAGPPPLPPHLQLLQRGGWLRCGRCGADHRPPALERAAAAAARPRPPAPMGWALVLYLGSIRLNMGAFFSMSGTTMRRTRLPRM